MRHPLETKIALTLTQHQLLGEGERALVGLSGGADSVALLLCLQALGHKPVAVHVNFKLRGAESTRDEEFVRTLCEHHSIPLEVFTHDTQTEAKERGESIEMAARRIRYTRFAEVSHRLNIQHTAVAHHKADNAETLLLNLIRGSGLRGLCGMRYKQGNIIRPFLDIDKAELLAYLEVQNTTYVMDSSNAVPDVKRNKLRLEVLPLLEQLNPSIIDTLHITAERLTESLVIYEAGLKQLDQGIVTRYTPTGIYTHPILQIDRKSLNQSPVASTILYTHLSNYGFNPQQIATILAQQHGQSGAVYHTGEWELHRERHVWALYPRVPQAITSTRLHEGINVIPGLGNISVEYLDRDTITTLQTPPHIALIDAERIQGALFLRPIATGERFIPLGMRQQQLISDHLTNNHLSLRNKQLQTAVCDQNGILWLTGVRPADTHKITAQTKRLVRLTLIQPQLLPAE